MKQATRASVKSTPLLAIIGAIHKNTFGESVIVFASKTGLDPALVSRVLNSKRDPTPLFIGRLARRLEPREAKKLIAAYLREVAAEIEEHRNG